MIAIAWLVASKNSKNKFRFILLLIGGGILAYVIAKISGHFISDPRPFIRDGVVPMFKSAIDNGFPSDHTLFTAVFAAAMWPFDKRLSVGFFVIAIVVGSARVVGGVHHVQDIVGSIAIAIISVGLVFVLSKLFARIKKSQTV